MEQWGGEACEKTRFPARQLHTWRVACTPYVRGICTLAISKMFITSLRDCSWVGAISLILSAALLLSLVARLRQFGRLQHFDGPFLAGFSRLWLVQTVWSGRAYLHFWDVTSKYGMDSI